MFDTKLPPFKLPLLASMVLAALSAGSAQATVMTQTQNFNGAAQYFSFYNSSTTYPDRTGTLTFNQFDTTLGTLTQVHIELLSSISGYVSASGYLDAAGPVTAVSTLSIDLDISIAGLANPVIETNLSPGSNCSVSDGFCYSYSDFANLARNSSYSVPGDGGALSIFEGLSTFGIDFSEAFSLSAVCTPDNLQYCGSFAYRSSVDQLKVTYTYEEASVVPEPGTLALLGLGLAGLGVMRRRSAAKRV